MSRLEKMIRQFMHDPSSIKYADLVQVLQYFGHEMINARGSHMKFKHPQLPYDLVIPVHRNECKPFYKREARKRIKLLIRK